MTLTPAWRRALPGLALAWLAVVALYWDTGAAMVHIWNRSETFAHAWVVPPISAWLVWRQRAELASLTPRPALRWLWLMPLPGLLWLMGDLAVANAATQFALVGMLVLLVPVLLGTEVARRLAFPLGFLFFAVPFGDFMTPWLIERTADFAVVAVRASGIPVFREGTQFVIPSGSWSVVEACSGIRYLMASVMVGTLFAYLNFRTMKKRWAFVGVAILTPLLANWLRAYMIVMLGHLSGNTLAVGVDHIIYGWVFFGVIMLAMFMVGARWADPDPEPVPAPVGQSLPPTAGWIAAATLAAAALAAVPQGLRSQTELAVAHQRPVLAGPALAGWTWVPEPSASWQPAFANPAAQLHGQLRSSAGDTIGLFIGYYRDQRPGHQLVTSVNRWVDEEDGEGWALTASGTTQQQSLPWRTAELRGQALSQVVGGGSLAPRLRAWQVYWINGRPITSDWQAKLYGAWLKLLGQGDDAAVVILYADKNAAGPDDALLREFVNANWTALDTGLRGVRDQARSGPR